VGLRLWPNPTAGPLRRAVEGAPGPVRAVRFLGMDGRLLQSFTNVPITINLTGLPEGVYLVKVIGDEWRATGREVVYPRL